MANPDITCSLDCLLCAQPIPDEDFENEDYYTVFRGHNAATYKGEEKAIEGFICFDCMQIKVSDLKSLKA